VQGELAPAVLMFVEAVVVALVWSFRVRPIVTSFPTCLDPMVVELSLMHKMDRLVLKWKVTFQ
jgi:hypothetical protein